MPWDEVSPLRENTAIPLSGISRGPRLGLQEALVASMEMQQRNNSIWGLSYYFSQMDDEQGARAKAAGKQYTPLFMQPSGTTIDEMGNEIPSYLGFTDVYKDIAKQIVDKKDSPYGAQIAAHNAHIAKLNAEDPNLKLLSMNEMFGEVKKKAHEAEYRGKLPWTWGGVVGGLAGSAIGGFDPRTDPLNALTAPLAAGATIPGRIAAQGAIQAGAEGVGQLTGVQENRRLLGLEQENPLWAIGSAAIGGAGFQFLGEAAAMGLRRVGTGKWFADLPNDPAPPPPAVPATGAMPGAARMAPGIEPALPTPLALAFKQAFPEPRSSLLLTRTGAARATSDLEHVSIALGAWGGPHPWEVPVPTVTRLPGQPADPTGFQIRPEPGSESLDVLARRYDPDLFNAYDRFTKQRNKIEVRLGKEEFDATLIAANEIARLNEQINELKLRAPRTQPLLANIASLEAEVAAKQEAIRISGRPETAAARNSLVHVNEQLRNMTAPLERAYSHAQGKWDAYTSQHSVEINHMIENGLLGIQGSPVRTPAPPPEPPVVDLPASMDAFIKKTGTHAITELQTTGVTPRPGEAPVDTALRVQKEQEPFVKEAQDKAVNTLIRVAKGEVPKPPEGAAAAAAVAPPDTITMRVHGREVSMHLDNDKIRLPGDDGEGERIVSVRELAKEMENDKKMLQAVTSCTLTS